MAHICRAAPCSFSLYLYLSLFGLSFSGQIFHFRRRREHGKRSRAEREGKFCTTSASGETAVCDDDDPGERCSTRAVVIKQRRTTP